jgi:hypothetical protein
MRPWLRLPLVELLIVAGIFVLAPEARADLPNTCESTAESASGVMVICPFGDGDGLADTGLAISVRIVDAGLFPIPNVPGEDFWLIGCGDLMLLCGGAGSINAAAPTDADGRTTITGSIRASGCDAGVRVVCQGVIIGEGPTCQPTCLPIAVRSPDQRGVNGGGADGVVTAADLSYFGSNYQSPPKPYVVCHDFAAPFGTVTLVDFVKLAMHYDHACL